MADVQQFMLEETPWERAARLKREEEERRIANEDRQRIIDQYDKLNEDYDEDRDLRLTDDQRNREWAIDDRQYMLDDNQRYRDWAKEDRKFRLGDNETARNWAKEDRKYRLSDEQLARNEHLYDRSLRLDDDARNRYNSIQDRRFKLNDDAVRRKRSGYSFDNNFSQDFQNQSEQSDKHFAWMADTNDRIAGRDYLRNAFGAAFGGGKKRGNSVKDFNGLWGNKRMVSQSARNNMQFKAFGRANDKNINRSFANDKVVSPQAYQSRLKYGQNGDIKSDFSIFNGNRRKKEW